MILSKNFVIEGMTGSKRYRLGSGFVQVYGCIERLERSREVRDDILVGTWEIVNRCNVGLTGRVLSFSR